MGISPTVQRFQKRQCIFTDTALLSCQGCTGIFLILLAGSMVMNLKRAFSIRNDDDMFYLKTSPKCKCFVTTPGVIHQCGLTVFRSFSFMQTLTDFSDKLAPIPSQRVLHALTQAGFLEILMIRSVKQHQLVIIRPFGVQFPCIVRNIVGSWRYIGASLTNQDVCSFLEESLCVRQVSLHTDKIGLVC